MKINFDDNMNAEQICSRLLTFLTEHFDKETTFSNASLMLFPSDNSYDDWKISMDSFENCSVDCQNTLLDKMKRSILKEYSECSFAIQNCSSELKQHQANLNSRQNSENVNQRLLKHSKTKVSKLTAQYEELNTRMNYWKCFTDGTDIHPSKSQIVRSCSNSKITKLHALMTFPSDNEDSPLYCYGTYSLADKSVQITFPSKLPLVFVSANSNNQ